jgi:hypothetical protein
VEKNEQAMGKEEAGRRRKKGKSVEKEEQEEQALRKNGQAVGNEIRQWSLGSRQRGKKQSPVKEDAGRRRGMH